jgi:DNA-binding beta-propeller fold protein YncE
LHTPWPGLESRGVRKFGPLYVVNYESGTVTKPWTSNMSTLQTIDACFHPIGITYDRATRRAWVACYTGSIRVYNDW